MRRFLCLFHMKMREITRPAIGQSSSRRHIAGTISCGLGMTILFLGVGMCPIIDGVQGHWVQAGETAEEEDTNAAEPFPELEIPEVPEDFASLDAAQRKEVRERFDEVRTTLYDVAERTRWGQFPHEFSTESEKRAYQERGFRVWMELNRRLLTLFTPEERASELTPAQCVYGIGWGYQNLYEIAAEDQRPAILEEMEQTFQRDMELEPLRKVVEDQLRAAKRFPFMAAINPANGTFQSSLSAEAIQGLIARFMDVLETQTVPEGSKTDGTDRLDGEIRYATITYLERLAFDQPEQMTYVLETLRRFQTIRPTPSVGRLITRLEMDGDHRVCPWKLSVTDPVSGTQRVVDFSLADGRYKLFVFLPVFRSHTLHLLRAQRRWQERGLDVYHVDHRYTTWYRKILPLVGLDWPVIEQVPADEPERERISFVKRYLGVWEVSDVCILIGPDGTVLTANLDQGQAVSKLGELLGDEAGAAEILRQTNERIQVLTSMEPSQMEQIPSEELTQWFQELVITVYRGCGGGMPDEASANRLWSFAAEILRRGDESAKSLAVRTMAELSTLIYDFGQSRVETITQWAESMESVGDIRNAVPLRCAEYRLQLSSLAWPRSAEQVAEYTESLVKLSDEIFAYLDKYPQEATLADTGEMILRLADRVVTDESKPELKQTALEIKRKCVERLTAGGGSAEFAKHVELLIGELRRLTLVGEKMPIDGMTLDGQPFDSERYRGKVVLVDFWATWCGYCIAEFPHVRKMLEKYHEQGFEVIGISTDDDLDALREYLDKNPLGWTCLVDQKLEEAGRTRMAVQYGVQAIPEMILLDRDGRVILLEARGERLEEKLAEIFDPSAPPTAW